jgi:hypothetical protein
LCVGKWHGEHGRRRNRGRVVIRAIKGFIEGGGKWDDIDRLKLSAMGRGLFDLDPLGYMAGTADIASEIIELTSELLVDALNLVHPDLHPPERQELAHRVTSQLLALKPFVFPAPKPAEPPAAEQRNGSMKGAREPSKLSLRTTYPCPDCADATPGEYCTACRAEWEKRQNEEHERERAKQRKWYARRKERRERLRAPTICATCGTDFKRKRKDARFCSDACRQKAHRKAPVTDKTNARRTTLFIRDAKRLILAAIDRHQAVFLNDLLPPERTNAEYQALCRAARMLEDHGEIESLTYWARFGKPGFRALHKPGFEIEYPDKIHRLKPDERVAISERLLKIDRTTPTQPN